VTQPQHPRNIPQLAQDAAACATSHLARNGAPATVKSTYACNDASACPPPPPPFSPRFQVPAASLGAGSVMGPCFTASGSPGDLSGESTRRCFPAWRTAAPHPSVSACLGLISLPARRTSASITSLRLLPCSLAIAVRICQQVSVRLTVRGRFGSPQRVRQSLEDPGPDPEEDAFITSTQPMRAAVASTTPALVSLAGTRTVLATVANFQSALG